MTLSKTISSSVVIASLALVACSATKTAAPESTVDNSAANESTSADTVGDVATATSTTEPPRPEASATPELVMDLVPDQEGPWFAEVATVPFVVPEENRFGEPNGATTETGSEAVAMFDVDGDGDLDIVTADGRSYLQVIQTDVVGGEVTLEQSAQYVGVMGDRVRNSAKAIGLHDFDNDGLLDVYAPNTAAGAFRALDPRDLASVADPANLVSPRRTFDAGYRYQLSNGDGTFTNADLGAPGDGTTRSALFADFDGDGNTDAYLSQAPYYGIWWGGSSVPNQLLPGLDGGVFGDDVLGDAVLTSDGRDMFSDDNGRAIVDFKGATVRDFDGDGRPDIAAGAYADVWDNVDQPPRQAQPEGGDVDLDGDGLPDGGYQGDWERGLMMLRNVSEPGTIRFEEVSNDAIDNAWGDTDQAHAYVAIPADIDHDADFDLLVAGPRNFTAHNSMENETDRIRVLRNDSEPGAIRFTDITEESGLAYLNDDAQLPAPYTDGVRIDGWMSDGTDLVMTPLWSAGAAIDVDNDTDLDWVAVDRQFIPFDPVSGEEFTMWVFLNDGSGHFEAVDNSIHGLAHTSRDISYGDIDGDGRVDIFAVNGSGGGQEVDDTNYLFLNNVANDNHWAKIDLEGPDNNPLGLGSTVTVYAAGTDQVLAHDEVRTDFAYRSKRSASLHVGLGPIETFDVVIVAPDGTTIRHDGLAADRQHRLAF